MLDAGCSMLDARCWMFDLVLLRTLILHDIVFLDGNRRGPVMKKKLAVVMFCLLLSTGCYVSTSVKVNNRQLPADFSAQVLVVTFEDKTGLGPEHLAVLEEDVLQALTGKGIDSITLDKAVGVDESERALQLLLNKDYSALLKVVIDFWGSKSETLQDPVPTSVDSSDTGPEPGSTFRPPTSFAAGETVPGPESSYKEVSMAWYLTDLHTSRRIWSGQVSARPGVVGRSFLYHRFNRNLKYEKLAQRCVKKLAGELSSAWPKETGK
jgi:hypothetical protein